MPTNRQGFRGWNRGFAHNRWASEDHLFSARKSLRRNEGCVFGGHKTLENSSRVFPKTKATSVFSINNAHPLSRSNASTFSHPLPLPLTFSARASLSPLLPL
ncbi:hypothetical protein CDAR_599131 [Caerostris darwini]|uniref:Uncharacterized protein n=1 Tax=Caerostris darwini TaxID=1538125 RepID=A0AAV4R891_9ARAC|nr:hypothetical protein CDAR_599131 [Caerostris darwini]